jgi:uncharacterized cupin superfamily protein
MEQAEDLTTIDLLSSVIRFDQDGKVRVERKAGRGGGWRMTAFHAKTPADTGTWTVNPDADELVSCLIGIIRLHIRPESPDEDPEIIRLTAGTAVVVPRGRRRRIELHTPSDILIVTLPATHRS